MTLPSGYDIVLIDEDEQEGYKLINPEGFAFVQVTYRKDISPGRVALLQEAEEKIQSGYEHRSVLANEADWFYSNGRKRNA